MRTLAAPEPPRTASPLIAVRNVSATLDGEPVLRNLDLDVASLSASPSSPGGAHPKECSGCGWCAEGEGCGRGPVVGLMGPSGIGKTTLLRILCGLLEPDCGTVTIATDDADASRGRMGLVSQHSPLFRHRTVLGNLLVAGAQAGLSENENRQMAGDFLQRLDVADCAGLYPAQLSGGQRQRVSIAQQFMCRRSLLLLDEPFSGLDCVTLHAVIGLLRDIMRQRDLRGIILVTHDVDAALESCDRLLLLGRDHPAGDQALPGARIQHDFDLRAMGIGQARRDPESRHLLLHARQEVCEAFRAL